MVPIWWIARKPEWEWMATGTPDHTSGFRERDLAVLLGIRTQSSRRLLLSHLHQFSDKNITGDDTPITKRAPG